MVRPRTWDTPEPEVSDGVARLSVSNGKGITLVSESDVELVLGYNWYLSKAGYAWTNHVGGDGKARYRFMHRLVIGAGRRQQVDHVNGNRLDNRRENLRVVSFAENQQNRHSLGSRNKSGVIGVHFSKRRNRWIAGIKYAGQQHCLGAFTDFDEAVAVRVSAEKKFFTHAPARALVLAGWEGTT